MALALAATAAGAPAPGPAGSFPYLQFGGDGGAGETPPVVVRWFSAPGETATVWLRETGGAWSRAAESCAGPRHEVALPALAPDRTYEYVIAPGAQGSPAAAGSAHGFRTPPADRATPFTFIAYGDNRSRPDMHRAVIRRMLAGPPPRFVLHTGDVVGSGADSAAWHVEFLEPAAELLARAPVLVTPGNHELDRTLAPRALGRFWYGNLTLPGNGTGRGAERWYAMRAGGCLLVCLDSTEPAAAGQTQWLRDTLAAADPRDFVIVAMHHPIWSWGGHGGSQPVRAEWGRLLDDPKVDVVFAGHNHFYQRTYPLRGGAAASRRPTRYRAGLGAIHCTAGGGGAPLYSPERDPRVAAQSERCHHVQVDYVPGRLTCTAIAHDGRVLDRFTLEKGTATPARQP